TRAVISRRISRALSTPAAWAVLAAGVIGLWVTVRICARAGGPALPLDDAFIHLQYARRLSEGSWFSYVPGGSYTTGATSWLWPMALAPTFWLGLDGAEPIWVCWLLGCLLHAGTMLEAARLSRGLVGDVAAWAVAAACLVFPAFAWFAYSGMETMALAYVLVLGARLASDCIEGNGGRGAARKLWALGLVAPLVRPEGAIVSVLASMALGLGMLSASGLRSGSSAPGEAKRSRSFGSKLLIGLSPLLGPCLIPMSHRLFAGHAVSSTAEVKWLLADPYLDAAGVYGATWANVELMFSDLLRGGIWTNRFLPEGFLWLLLLGLLSMLWLGWRTRRLGRALVIFAVVAGTLGVCTYETLLWNRVRYIWPFAPAWFVAASCFPVALARLLVTGGRRQASVGRYRVIAGIVSPILLWGGAAWLAMKLPSAIDDVAQSARAIELQQVKLGRWAEQHLPPNARVGVNDTGAIAYFSRRPTFDVVGLTTEGEARHWAAGAGSRFEHYERLGARHLPTHFIVYPNWMGIPQLLGAEISRATVVDQSILGGRTMIAYEAVYDRLGSGQSPLHVPRGARLLAELDVADLVSEAHHDYAVTGSRSRDNRPISGTTKDGRTIVDGGRRRRLEDRFTLRPQGASIMVIRAAVSAPLEVWSDESRQDEPQLRGETSGWQEFELALPGSQEERTLRVRRAGGRRFTALHYWWYAATTSGKAGSENGRPVGPAKMAN
ncbi:MAG: hypothetical protein VB934_10900, partial [Polyangiaceae bacterium]